MDGSGIADDEADLTLLSRDELEERVRRRTADLENLMDAMADVLLKIGPEGRITMANQAVESVLGYDPDAVTGKPIDHLIADVEDDDQLSAMMTEGALVETLVREGHVTDVEAHFEPAAGDPIPMSVSASTMLENGEFAGVVCVAKDISERKAAEQRAEFLHSLLRHDVGNKLQVVEGYLDLVDEDDVPAEAATHFERARDGIEEAIELIENVRTLQRVEGERDREPVALAPTIRQAIERHDDRREELGVDVETDLDSVRVLAGSILKELFANLVENALVHSRCDVLRVRTDVRADDVLVTVEDDGVGIPDDRKDEIVERGAKGEGSSGSGLGMYLASEIADTYEGDFEVRDAELGGARFDVTLQLAE